MSTVAKVYSVAPIGFDGYIIDVESDATRGLPSLQIVGLGNKAIDEAKERVKSAITNSLLEYPARLSLSTWHQPNFRKTVRITTYLSP
jgi:magnesium chelatase family protein